MRLVEDSVCLCVCVYRHLCMFSQLLPLLHGSIWEWGWILIIVFSWSKATRPLLDREAPGLTVAMISKSLSITPMAMLSRWVVDRGQDNLCWVKSEATSFPDHRVDLIPRPLGGSHSHTISLASSIFFHFLTIIHRNVSWILRVLALCLFIMHPLCPSGQYVASESRLSL